MTTTKAGRRATRVSAALIALAVALAVLPVPPDTVETQYSRGLYPLIQNMLTPLAGLTGVAMFDLLLAGVLVGLALGWYRLVGRSRGWSRLRGALLALVHTAGLAAALYLLFLLVWGMNYRREPMTSRLDYSSERVTPEALSQLASVTVGALNQLHGQAHQRGWPSLDRMPDHLGPAFEQAQQRLGLTRLAVTGEPKTTLLAPYFRWAGIDGMISPFSLEILVNDGVLPFERPHVVAHEWAHLAGFADESEASFVGWLTCLAGDAGARYSAWLALMPRVMRHLPDAERDGHWAALTPGPSEDLQAVAARLRGAIPVVQRNANRVYDQYLRANRVDAGIASYGEVVTLILGTDVWRQ